ncbi:MAG: hypothetical protein ACE5FK_00265 [Candidatus Methylomirabilia bacterium]
MKSITCYLRIQEVADKAVSVLLLTGILMLGAACATSEQWAEWRTHSNHFASGHHLLFSLQNREGKPQRATQQDFDAARDENWWGEPLTVTPQQLFKE